MTDDLSARESATADNLLNLVADAGAAGPLAGEPGDASAPAGGSERPAGIPEKFWDEEKSELRTEALVKSYVELERKLSGLSARELPARPEDYDIKIQTELLESDADLNRRLHAAGFSQEQAQLVYDLASERLMPMVAEIATLFETEGQVARLAKHFGGDQRWRETARQLDTWGRANLPQRVFDALSTTYEGVLAMERMMSNGEPGLVREGEAGASVPTEADLKQLMRDPRYWRDQDPVTVAKVREGFRKLYRD